MHLLIASLALLATPAFADERVVVAVADFEVAGAKELAPLGKGLAQMLITDLSVSESVRLVERSRLHEVLGEIALQKSPYFDPAGAAKLGKGLGAELVVTGQLFAEGNALRLDVRAIDVESAEVLYAGKVVGAREKIFDLQKQLAGDVLAGLGAKTTPIGKKQIGKRGTQSFEALATFGAALDAEDRGAAEEVKRQLALALKADPEFGAAKDRLAALEERVDTLERSGSLILKPTTWRDHLHNFKAHRANADLVQAEKSLRLALELEPRRAELWASLADLPTARRKEMIDGARLDAEAKAALAAYLASDLGALRDARESPENPAFRSVLAIDLLGRSQIAFTLTGAAVLERAIAFVLDAKNRKHAEAMLIDSEAFFALAKQLKRDRLDGRDPPSEWLSNMVLSGPEGKTDGASSAWKLELRLAERPSSPIEVKLATVALEPGEKPYPNDGLWGEARAKAGEYAWYVNPGTDPFASGGIKGTAAFGSGFQVPREDRFVECEPATKSPAGQSCVVLFTLQKATVPPGPYAVELSYRDAAGAEVRYRDPRLWIWEFKLAEFKTGLWMHSDPWYFVNLVDDRVRERLDPALAKSAMAALPCANPPIASGAKSPLVRIHWDLDAKLKTADPKKYRAAILARGGKAKPHRDDGCAYAGLPKLRPGTHTLCFVAERSNGSITIEPECFPVEVPARYPQEGRKPRE